MSVPGFAPLRKTDFATHSIAARDGRSVNQHGGSRDERENP